MAEGYLYVLTNPHVPKLVKIGYTDRDPDERAMELSTFTGVPGKWTVRRYWRLNDANYWERRIFDALAEYRETGEFFRMRLDAAIVEVTALLDEWGAFSRSGVPPTRKLQAISPHVLAALENARILDERKRNENDAAIHWATMRDFAYRDALGQAERKCGFTLAEITDIESERNLASLIAAGVRSLVSGLAPVGGKGSASQLTRRARAAEMRRELYSVRDHYFEQARYNFFKARKAPCPRDD